jgi:hypothetical protein
VPAIGVWLERYIVAAPSTLMDVQEIPLGVLELGLTIGFIGGFVWVITNFLSSVPAVTFTDPLMNPHPDDVHVRSMDAPAH